MSENAGKFVYVTWIASTAEKVFAALSDPEMTRQYWGVSRNVSDWKPGSRWQHVDSDDATKVQVVGTVLECEPPKKLVVTWVSPADEGNAAKTTRVTYLVEPMMGAVKLTLMHENLDADSPAYKATVSGWSAILSSLKTLLETGRPMEMTTRRWGGGAA